MMVLNSSVQPLHDREAELGPRKLATLTQLKGEGALQHQLMGQQAHDLALFRSMATSLQAVQETEH